MVRNGMRPIHPGEVLREEFMKPRGLSANALARALRVTPARINDIVRERRAITGDTGALFRHRCTIVAQSANPVRFARGGTCKRQAHQA